MPRVVINKCYGGFGLSHAAVLRYAEIKGIHLYFEMNEISKKYHDSIDDPGAIVHYWTSEDRADDSYWWEGDIDRDDPALVQVVDEMKEKASGRFAKLVVVEIPDDVEYEIEEYDGTEWIAEKHRTWA